MSVGLPSWQEFIGHLTDELGLDSENVLGPELGYRTLAEYYRIKQGSIGPLRSWMDREWKVAEEKVRASKMHELVVALDFPIIYTTNYDRNIEVAFEVHGRDYVKIANTRDIARARDNVTQIVKFHGDFDDDDSLVLTETDYFSRLEFNAPLDVKFRLLLHNIRRTWKASGYERDRPKSFVFMAAHNPMQEAILGEWGIDVLHGESNEPSKALTDFLGALLAAVKA